MSQIGEPVREYDVEEPSLVPEPIEVEESEEERSYSDTDIDPEVEEVEVGEEVGVS